MERRSLSALSDMTAIASSAMPVRNRLEESVYALQRAVPFVAFQVGYRTPAGMNTVIANGYADRTLDHFESSSWIEEARGVISGTGQAKRLHAVRQQDLADPDANLTVREYLRPAGFHGGATCFMRSPQGEFTGVLNVSVESSSEMDEQLRDVMEIGGAAISSVVDEYQATIHGHATYVVDSLGRLRFQSGPDVFGDERFRSVVERRLERLDHRSTGSTRFADDEAEYLMLLTPVSNYRGLPTKAILTVRLAEPLPLTERETEVAQLVAAGLSNPQIAEEMIVGRRTVATHIEHILQRTGLENRTQIAVWACLHGLAPLGTSG